MQNFKIIGGDLQAVEVTLAPSQSVRAEAGTFLLMEEGITMETKAEGGFFSGLKRMVVGESFFITSFVNTSQQERKVYFSAPYPGQIIPLDIAQMGGEIICQRDSFICGSSGINVDIAFTKKLGAGFFGGEGFVLQKISGQGTVFVHSGGTVIQRQLAQGEKLHVDTGCLVAFSPTVDYDIQMMRGFKNMLFGGEGLFLANLTGPGTVFLQTLPFSRLADRIASATKGAMSNSGESTGVGGINAGGILGNIISGSN